MAVLPDQSGPKVLQDVGKMLVLDMVTNNHDRVPLGGLGSHRGQSAACLTKGVRCSALEHG